MNNQVDEIKNKIDIVSLLSEYIDVKKAGKNYKANCPFHGERTPSFMISPELQMYKCFGCGESGDIFTFIEKREGMEFGEALKYLADKAGVKLVNQNFSESSEKDKLYEINKKALAFYKYALLEHQSGKKALDYLQNQRGLSLESIRMFGIGYSPEKPGELYKFLNKDGKFAQGSLSKSGLFSGSGGGKYDKFFGRVVFPLYDHRGQIVGFSGRILPWARQDSAKYINSPETVIYHKSKVLYGFNITKEFVRSEDEALVVEGELDLISSFQAGIKNVVAIKGSALTEDQIRLIGRFTQKITLCLDSDFAGSEAARRGAIIAENLGFEVKVVMIDGYKDPDEIARGNPQKFKKDIKEAVGIWDFLIEEVVKKYGLESAESKRKIGKEIIPILGSIEDKIVQTHYAEVFSRKISVPLNVIIDQIGKKEGGQEIGNNQVPVKQTKTRRDLLEEKVLSILVSKKPELLLVDDIQSLIKNSLLQKIITQLMPVIKENPKASIADISKNMPKELSEKFSELVLSDLDNEEVDPIIRELKIISLKEEMEDLAEKVKLDESNQELLKKFSILSKKLSTL